METIFTEVKCYLTYQQKIISLKILFLSKKLRKKLIRNIYIETKSRGMFLEVDLNYPKKLHKLHRDFPLAPVRYLSLIHI